MVSLLLRRLHYPALLRSQFSLQQQLRSVVSLSEDGRKLKLQLEEETRRYSSVWLRHNCQCPQCYDTPTAMGQVGHNELSLDAKITSAELKDDTVQIQWISSIGDHSGYIPVQWLRDVAWKEKHDKDNTEPLIATTIPVMDYSEMIGSDEGTYKWFKQMNYYGISLIQNAGTSMDILPQVVGKFPHSQTTLLGEYCPIFTAHNPNDVGYGTIYLYPHQDYVSYESPPGLLLFHCIRRDSCVEGGESVFVDAYPLLKTLRRDYPKRFETLTKVPVTFHRRYAGNSPIECQSDLKSVRPHIQLDDRGEIQTINWNTYHQDPISTDNEELVHDYYDAFIYLSKMMDKPEFKLEHCLMPGEIICFNNRRMLHSRNSFQLNGGVRHFNGVYFNIDYLRSQLLVLGRRLNKQDKSRNIFGFF